MSEPLTEQDLLAFITSHQIEGDILTFEQPTPTVRDAAKAAGTDEEHIVKSVLFLINNEPLLAITCGTRKVDQRAIAQYLKVGRKRVKLANAEAVLAVTGYSIGTVPPFGHKQPIRTLIDPLVLQQKRVYAGGGAENALVSITPQEILRVTKADIIDLHGI